MASECKTGRELALCSGPKKTCGRICWAWRWPKSVLWRRNKRQRGLILLCETVLEQLFDTYVDVDHDSSPVDIATASLSCAWISCFLCLFSDSVSSATRAFASASGRRCLINAPALRLRSYYLDTLKAIDECCCRPRLHKSRLISAWLAGCESVAASACTSLCPRRALI